MKRVNIYLATTLCTPQRQDGYCGYVLEMETVKGPATLFGCDKLEQVTAQQAELIVLIKALKRIKECCRLIIYTESEYVAAGFEQDWIEKWEDASWLTARGKPVANKEEWQQMKVLLGAHEFSFMVKEQHSYKRWLQLELKKKENSDV